MPTHVSQSVRELKELGRNLYAAMRSDFEVNSNASALPLDYFERIVTWYQAHKGDATMMDDVMEACGRAGLSASDADELRDYADTLYRSPSPFSSTQSHSSAKVNPLGALTCRYSIVVTCWEIR